MRKLMLPTLLTSLALHGAALAQQPLALKRIPVQVQPGVADLVCEAKSPVLRAPAAPNADPMEIPTEETVELMVPDEATAPAASSSGTGSAGPDHGLPATAGYRIGIWGDSHLAANFFTEELAKLLKLPTDSVSNALLPANMGRAGVRLPLRRSCVSGQWKYEPGYVGGESAAAPGPGLISMFSDQPGASLAWDVRKDSRLPGYERVRLLYQQTATPITVGVSVDGGAEKELTLDEAAGPAALELVADQPMAQVRLRLIGGSLRFQGMELLSAQANPFELDVFGYPGATVAAWKNANLDYFRTWFSPIRYRMVMLEFGTNEGNVKPFDLAAYRRVLADSVRNMRAVFPDAACVLIAPGDRGVLVPRSLNVGKGRKKSASAHGKKASAAARTRKRRAGPAIDLLLYSRIHAQIGQVQAQVAADAGCTAWSMQDAMGGQGSAYAWARQSPPLMAGDLIHFTVAGYQRLAQKFAKDMGWNAQSPAR